MYENFNLTNILIRMDFSCNPKSGRKSIHNMTVSHLKIGVSDTQFYKARGGLKFSVITE